MKCEFLNESVEYLGHKGLHALLTKVTAIVEAPELQNVQELRSFLELLNYCARFILNCKVLYTSDAGEAERQPESDANNSQVKRRNRVNHRNLKLYNAILNELVDPQTCTVINLCTIILCSLM